MNSKANRLVRSTLAGAAAGAILWLLFASAISGQSATPAASDGFIAASFAAIVLLSAAASALLFGGIPMALELIMGENTSFLAGVNRLALFVALASVFSGVFVALLMIFGSGQANPALYKSLLACVVLFIGSACTLCTIKFFHANENN